MRGWGYLTYIRRVLYNVNFGNKYIGKSQSSLSSKTKNHLTIMPSMVFSQVPFTSTREEERWGMGTQVYWVPVRVHMISFNLFSGVHRVYYYPQLPMRKITSITCSNSQIQPDPCRLQSNNAVKPRVLNPFLLPLAHLGNAQPMRPAPRLLVKIIGNHGKDIKTLINRNSITMEITILLK